MATNITMSRTRKGNFSDVGKAAAESASTPAATPPLGAQVLAAQPQSSAPEALPPDSEEAPSARHPIYDSQDGEEGDSGHAQLMHDLGLAIQEMMKKDPETNKSMSDLMEEFTGKGVDYDSESKRLKSLIEKRQTPKAPNWVASGVASWAGGPDVKARFHELQDQATTGAAKKQSDMEGVEAKLLGEHVEDLRAKGKSKDALLLGLVQGMMSQKRTETTEEGKSQRAEQAANLRRELQERALGAAEERVRLNISNRKDVANQDRTAAQVMHLYESLLRQSEKDITGAVKPLYTAEEAMDMALNTILPKVKPGIEALKKGEAPVAPEGTAVEKPKTGGSKFAQWKASQAAVQRK